MSARLAKFALMFGNFVIGVAILAPAGMLAEPRRALPSPSAMPDCW